MKKQCVAMLLAGGQGSRLHVLTSRVAKPAVPFGGKYRIIDFTLSNCANSGIDTVGVLTQYQPLELNAYVGNGAPWDLDRSDGGVCILPPYVREGSAGEWYKGTANAIYQNIGYIDMYDPDYVLVLSGDHIYQMDYAAMLEHHRRQKAACTISVIEVNPKEAGRFGIMNVDAEDMIYEFEEKPRYPKSNLASMGVYIFTWSKLRDYLIADEAKKDTRNDFGGDIIPTMLAADERMAAFRFLGYWKDVGTIDSLWEANMDMLAVQEGRRLFFTERWPIYTRSPVRPPHFTGPDARVSHSLTAAGSTVQGTVERSVLFSNVFVGKGAVVRHSILMPGAAVEDGAVVEYAVVGEHARIAMGARVGKAPETGRQRSITVIAGGAKLLPCCEIAAGAVIDENGLEVENS